MELYDHLYEATDELPVKIATKICQELGNQSKIIKVFEDIAPAVRPEGNIQLIVY